jgi:metallo-beta-lactamase family protein
MRVEFLGGVGTVTGSRTMLTTRVGRVLVDCGLFQGLKSLRLKNWDQFPVNPKSIQAIFLTHAHLDHSGYLPRMVKEGFRGPIYCSMPTADLCKILLFDSAKLMEEEARYANKRGYSKHAPALPLYESTDVERTLTLFEPIQVDAPIEAFGMRADFFKVGHILGACGIRLSETTQEGAISIVFSGDLGRPHDDVMVAPDAPLESDYLVVESTYGDRRHPQETPIEELANCISEALLSGGVLLIPAFTVGRAQQLLYAIARLKKEKRIPAIPVHVDSPMATDVTELYLKSTGFHRMGPEECVEMLRDEVRFVRSPEDSKKLDEAGPARIIISASGMATGGRVLHHLHALASDKRNTILFAGFQAAGTRGAALVSGVDEVKIHGQYIKIRAKVKNLGSFSAHADYEETMSWLATRPKGKPLKRIFVNHGEPSAADALRRRISERFGWECSLPNIGDAWEL